MILTNKYGLPELVFKYLEQEFYDTEAAKGTISATTLLKPIKEIILFERYKDILRADISERLWSLLGSSVHAVLEKLELPDMEKERRLFAEIEGETISGKFDVIYQNHIYDYKTTSAYTKVYGDRLPEWQKQLSIYRWLYWKDTGKELEREGYIIAIYRDWSEYNAKKINNYPFFAMEQITLRLDPFKDIEKFIREKIKKIQYYRELPNEELPNCEPHERWVNSNKGQAVKCLRYCPVRQVCAQGIAEKALINLKY